MKIVSWNVNGLKACWGKGLDEFLFYNDFDFICLQETKVNEVFRPIAERYRYGYWNNAIRRGYSGTACFCRQKPKEVRYGIGENAFDNEGRVITLSYPTYHLINVYVPNSKGSKERFFYRTEWDEAFRGYVARLKDEKPTIICGDFNVARSYIDIYPENLLNDEFPTGFLDEEREGFARLLDVGFLDSFRTIHPEEKNSYTWWSNRLNKRQENRGWRIDYILIDNALRYNLVSARILSEIYGSDHCPIEVELRYE